MKNDSPTVELFVRSLVTDDGNEKRGRVVERLERMDREDVLSSFRIRVCGDGLVVDSRGRYTERGSPLCHNLMLLAHWEALNDAARRRFCVIRTLRETGNEEEALITAPMVLVEYNSTRLSFATPFETEARLHTIEDHLDAIEYEEGETVTTRLRTTEIEDPFRTGLRTNSGVTREQEAMF